MTLLLEHKRPIVNPDALYTWGIADIMPAELHAAEGNPTGLSEKEKAEVHLKQNSFYARMIVGPLIKVDGIKEPCFLENQELPCPKTT